MNEGEVVGPDKATMTRSFREKLIKAERNAELAADQHAELEARVLKLLRVEQTYQEPYATGEETTYQVARWMELETLRNRWPDSYDKVGKCERQVQNLHERIRAMEMQKKKNLTKVITRQVCRCGYVDYLRGCWWIG